MEAMVTPQVVPAKVVAVQEPASVAVAVEAVVIATIETVAQVVQLPSTQML